MAEFRAQWLLLDLHLTKLKTPTQYYFILKHVVKKKNVPYKDTLQPLEQLYKVSFQHVFLLYTLYFEYILFY